MGDLKVKIPCPHLHSKWGSQGWNSSCVTLCFAHLLDSEIHSPGQGLCSRDEEVTGTILWGAGLPVELSGVDRFMQPS